MHHQTTRNKSGEESPHVPSPPPQRGRGEDTPFENCAQKRRVGATNANIYTPFCTDVTSVISPLAIEGHTDEDGKIKPAPVTVKIEGAEREKEEVMAPAATTTALAQLTCCICGLQSSCKTARYACRRVGRNCYSYQVWGAIMVHRTRHRQDTQLRPTRRQAHRAVLHDD